MTNKELKAAYKELKPQMGVYQIENKATGKVLIEGSTDIPAKWNRHRTELRFGSHRNKALQRDWNELGADGFIFSVLSELEIKENEPLNVRKEVKVLEEMVVEEIGLAADKRY